jgi:hypothetical protein
MERGTRLAHRLAAWLRRNGSARAGVVRISRSRPGNRQIGPSQSSANRFRRELIVSALKRQRPSNREPASLSAELRRIGVNLAPSERGFLEPWW